RRTPTRPGTRTDPGRRPRQLPRNLVIAGQRIHVGIHHAGTTLTVEASDTTFRVHNGDQLVAEVTRTTVKPIARFKVRKPEPSRAARTPQHRDEA
ncbi:hypothetical protein MTQ08_22405, partial [Micromonospora sp. R42004]|nr:hypothetical protein [Micromonospora sp. R42004]